MDDVSHSIEFFIEAINHMSDKLLLQDKLIIIWHNIEMVFMFFTIIGDQ